MKEGERDRLKRHAQQKRDRIVTRAEEEYRKAVEGIETAWRLSREMAADRVAEANPATPNMDVVKEFTRILPELPGSFRVADVIDALQRHTGSMPNRSSVSSVLRRQAQAGKIREIVRGKGRRSGLYGKNETVSDATG